MDDSSCKPIRQKQRRTSSLEDLLLLRRKQEKQQQQQKHQLQASHRQLTSSPVVESSDKFNGGCSPAARKLGRYVDEELYNAFSSTVVDLENRRRCISHVIQCLDAEILRSAKVRTDLQAYRLDLCGFLQPDDVSGDNSDVARRMLGNLEYRVATLRDRLLFPLHYQQLIDLSHLCGCIHSIRMRLGFVGSAKQQQQQQQQAAAVTKENVNLTLKRL